MSPRNATSFRRHAAAFVLAAAAILAFAPWPATGSDLGPPPGAGLPVAHLSPIDDSIPPVIAAGKGSRTAANVKQLHTRRVTLHCRPNTRPTETGR